MAQKKMSYTTTCVVCNSIIRGSLSLKDLENPPSLAYKRIYDRVLEMCPIRLKMVGASRRTANATDRRDAARRILGLTKGQDQ